MSLTSNQSFLSLACSGPTSSSWFGTKYTQMNTSMYTYVTELILGVDRGSPGVIRGIAYRMITRNGYVALSNLRSPYVARSFSRKCHVPCHYLF